jgi:hypothetical protein
MRGAQRATVEGSYYPGYAGLTYPVATLSAPADPLKRAAQPPKRSERPPGKRGQDSGFDEDLM